MAAGQIAGKGVMAYGQLLAGQATSDSLNAQADLQIQNAQEALAQGKFNAQRSQIQSGQKIGAEVAGYGASGVRSSSGSVMNVLAAATSNAEMDRLNILHGADIKAISYENAASMERTQAHNAKIGSYFGAVGSLVGASSAGNLGATPSAGGDDLSFDAGSGSGYAGSDSYSSIGEIA